MINRWRIPSGIETRKNEAREQGQKPGTKRSRPRHRAPDSPGQSYRCRCRRRCQYQNLVIDIANLMTQARVMERGRRGDEDRMERHPGRKSTQGIRYCYRVWTEHAWHLHLHRPWLWPWLWLYQHSRERTSSLWSSDLGSLLRFCG